MTISEVFAQQMAAYKAKPSRSLAERTALLEAFKAVILKNTDNIKAALKADFRKPAAEVELSDIGASLSDIDFALANLAAWTGNHEVPTPPVDMFAASKSYIRYEPKGVCLIISPWNYPFLLTFGPLASCLAAGNRAIIKPSENTPHSSALIAKMMAEAFSPTDVAVAEGDKNVATELLSMPFHHIFFTGGSGIGKAVAQHASANLASCTLELGGKSPVIVDETADIAHAAGKIAWGKTFNAGQTCIAPDYVLVHESVRDHLVGGVNAVLDHLYGNSEAALEDSENYTVIVNDAHFNRISSWVDEAVSAGAKVVRGNTKVAAKRFISPTILTDVPANTKIMTEEIFGPVIPIVSYTNVQEVIDHVNANEKPLSLYVFSKNDDTINNVLSNTSSGGACVNDVVLQFFSPFLPFGGVNNSGTGKAHGFYGFQAFSNEKSVLHTTTA